MVREHIWYDFNPLTFLGVIYGAEDGLSWSQVRVYWKERALATAGEGTL